MKEQRKSVGARIVQGLREFAEALEQRRPIAENFNCRVIELDFRSTPYSPELVKETRKSLRASQKVFAKLLGVSVKTVCAWEQGINKPMDVACRFMDEIRRDPSYWLNRLSESAIAKKRVRE